MNDKTSYETETLFRFKVFIIFNARMQKVFRKLHHTVDGINSKVRMTVYKLGFYHETVMIFISIHHGLEFSWIYQKYWTHFSNCTI